MPVPRSAARPRIAARLVLATALALLAFPGVCERRGHVDDLAPAS